MTGRQLFSIFAPLLKGGASCLKLLPHSLVAACWWPASLVPGIPGVGLRYMLARRLCRHCGDNVLFSTLVVVKYWRNLSLGDNVTVQHGCYLDAMGGISIGSQVSIAHATSLVSFEHSWEDETVPIKYNELRMGPIEIASDVWVGCGVRILAGCHIGRRTVIAAGAVVPRGAYSAGVFGGVPARQLKSFSPAGLRQS